jgi:hypothetical protein
MSGRWKYFATIFAGAMLSVSCSQSSNEPKNAPGYANNPLGVNTHVKPLQIISVNFEPNQIIRTTNALRKLGRTEALQSLHAYYYSNWPISFEKYEDVEIICGLLFINPDGWTHPGFGVPMPFTRPDATNLFPNFPIAFSNGVPFLLAMGYASGGGGPGGEPTLARCQDLELIAADMKLCDKKSAIVAAEALVASSAFKSLYRDDVELSKGKEFVLAQAYRVGE